MALLKFTQEIIDSTKPPRATWHEAEIVSAEDKPAKNDSSKTICHVTLRLLSELDTKKDVSNQEKEKTTWIDYGNPKFATDLLCAVFNITNVDALLGREIDLTRELPGVKLNVNIKQGTWNGKPTWEFDGFMPAGVVPF
jgi:hypothetical protein